MTGRLWAGALALACIAAAPDRVAMTAEEQAAVTHAVERGSLMYHYDQAAWHGTDVMREQIGDRLGEIGGWIVDGPAERPEILFFDRDPVDPRPVFVAHLEEDQVISSQIVPRGEEAKLSPARKRLVAALLAARNVVRAAKLQPCTNAPFNTIVVPPTSDTAPIDVYFITAQIDERTLPMGGHYVVEVDAKGVAGTPRPFTKACLNATPDPGKGMPAALVVTHLLGTSPTELHVFSTLAAHHALYVMTREVVWRIDTHDGHPTVTLLSRAKN